MRVRGDESLIKDVAAGVLGGLAGAWAMTQFERLILRLVEGEGAEEHRPEVMTDGQLSAQPTVKTAQRMRTRPLSRQEKLAAQRAVHLSFGALVGAAYGVLAGRVPGVGAGAGLPYGTAVWLAADEAALPLLGLSQKPEYPIGTRVQALAAHWVYGFVTDKVGRLARRLLV